MWQEAYKMQAKKMRLSLLHEATEAYKFPKNYVFPPMLLISITFVMSQEWSSDLHLFTYIINYVIISFIKRKMVNHGGRAL
jgi:hypothetical protein